MTMHDRDDRSVGRDIQGDLVCTQCARVAGSVQGPNNHQMKTVTLRVQDPRHADAV
jgi:hypothetical protein